MLTLLLLISVPFLTGLNGPDGLYATDHCIYICEETAGRVLRVTSRGAATVVAEGLDSPEGIFVFDDGRVLVVEDTASGRLLELHNDTIRTIAAGLSCPEGVTADNLGTIWFTTGGIEGGSLFTTLWKIIDHTPIRQYSLPSVFSFSDLEISDDGIIYICSESSGIVGDVAVFSFDPSTSELKPFVTGVVACEGIGMTCGDFPMYITEESGSVHKVDLTGEHTLVTGDLDAVEDVVFFNNSIYISEDGTGSLVRLGINE